MPENIITRSIRANVSARAKYNTRIEMKISDQETEEEIQRKLTEAAQLAVAENLQPEITITCLDEEQPATGQNEQDTTDKPTSPYTVQCLQQGPACVFPVKNEVTGNIVWFEVAPSGYGIYVTVHQHQPSVQNASQLSPETAMATVHVDYYVDVEEEKEQIKVQLWDEQAGPYGDPGWNIPDAYTNSRDASIILVQDVQRWRPPEDTEALKK